MHQQALGVDEDMPLLAFDLLARVIAVRIDAAPFFPALQALRADHGRCGRGLAANSFAALDVEGEMDALESAVPTP